MTSYSDYYSDIYSDISIEEDDFKSVIEHQPDPVEPIRKELQQDPVDIKEYQSPRKRKLKLVTKLKSFVLMIKKTLKNPYQKKMNKKQKIEKLP